MGTSRGDFSLVTHPDKNPACDFITRSTVGPFVDTGVDVLLRPQPGMQVQAERVYLSVNTIGALAQFAGVSVSEGNSADREAQLKALGKLEGLNEGLGDDLATVVRTLDRWLDDAGVSRGHLADDSAL